MHTRLAGRDGGVAARYTKMWHGRMPRIHVNFRFLGVPGKESRVYTVSTGLPVNCAISPFCLTGHHTKTVTIHPRGAAERHAP